jgi:hypothetical protein
MTARRNGKGGPADRHGWPTPQSAAPINALPKRQRSQALQQAVSKLVTAVTLANAVGTTDAQPLGADVSFMHSSYGQDFAAYALIIGCFAFVYCMYRVLAWSCRTEVQRRLASLIATLSLTVLCWAGSTVKYSVPALWAEVRNHALTPVYVIFFFLAVIAACNRWARCANWHFRQVQYE